MARYATVALGASIGSAVLKLTLRPLFGSALCIKRRSISATHLPTHLVSGDHRKACVQRLDDREDVSQFELRRTPPAIEQGKRRIGVDDLRARIRPTDHLPPDQAAFAVARSSGGTGILRNNADWHRHNHRTPVRRVPGYLCDRNLADKALRDADVVRVRDVRQHCTGGNLI